MTDRSDIDVRDLNSVRAAEKESAGADVVLGDDFVAPVSTVDREVRLNRENRRRITLRGSPLARKIVMFNLIGLMILVAGVMFLNPSRDSLAFQRGASLASESQLVANIIEAEMPTSVPVNLETGDGIDIEQTLKLVDLRPGVDAIIFSSDAKELASTVGQERVNPPAVEGLNPNGSTVLTDAITNAWSWITDRFNTSEPLATTETASERALPLVEKALDGSTHVGQRPNELRETVLVAASPIWQRGNVVGVVALSTAGEIDLLVRQEREQILQVFVIALLVSIGLSLVLASAIANPISDLAAAAELGRARNAGKMTTGRIRIPDLSGRPDEIGRLSRALRSMVGALYDRIDSNEQFAADVAHEIKNPLASLRSAVGTLHVAKRDDQREKLLEVIDHDVRRLDRLVSDISNASRLDSELVKEEEETFDLIKMLRNLCEYLGQQAEEKGVEFVQQLPEQPVIIDGLEPRLAQVFVNLITNATSFCENGDAIRVWARQRDERVLVVVEDTGPGIPDNALTKIFQRFYSERPEGQFGNNSGLGLAISKQIVEAHGGVIWAENIRPADADVASPPLGARFVVGLPV